MKCVVCGAASPEGATVCGCGAPLPPAPAPACPQCGQAAPAEFRFCGHCGAALAGAATGAAGRAPAAAERRQLTVMFVDLAGSTELADRMDPEEWREVVGGFQELAAQEVHRYEGHIAQYLGDGILVYFGYPTAHEDDARRAVQAGLGILHALARRNQAAGQGGGGVVLAARLGIHTGPVVAGEIGGGRPGGRRETLALGSTPNVAARLQALARPGAVVTSDRTHALVEGFFQWTPLGPQTLKGLAEPIEVFEAHRETGMRTRFELARARGLTPAVGRGDELAALRDRLALAEAGQGQVVDVVGEAGLGKSRLLHLFSQAVPENGHTWVVGRCTSDDRHSPFHAIIEMLEAVLRPPREAPPSTQVEALRDRLSRWDLGDEESVTLVADLLSIPLPNHARPDLTPAWRRVRTLAALVALIERSAEFRPVVLVVEDLHWADPSTLELLTTVAARLPSRPLLFVASYRPDFQAPWAGQPNRTVLALERLAEPEARRLAANCTGGKPLPARVLDHVLARAGGVPLFIEELVRAVLESGLLRETAGGYAVAGELPEPAIPSTLQDSLMARLDRLGEARPVVQVASVLGREFSAAMLEAVAGSPPAAVRREVARLVEAQLLQPADAGATRYSFKHALFQEAAYGSLLKATRSQLHHRVATALTEQFAEEGARRPEVLAHHCAMAGLVEPAIAAWLRAGRWAVDRSANLEALDHLERAHRLVAARAPSPARDRQELEVLSVLGQALVAARGYASTEVEQVYTRAQALCGTQGDTPQLFWILWGLGVFHLVRANLREATSESLVRIAEHLADPVLREEAYFTRGVILFYQGELARARSRLEEALALNRPDHYQGRVPPTGVDPGVTARSFLALALWLLGDARGALAVSGEGVAGARALGHPFSLAFALVHAAFLHAMRGAAGEVLAAASEGRALSEAKGFVTLIPEAEYLLGWAGAASEEPLGSAAALARMRGSVEAWRGHGARIWLPYFLSGLAEAHRRLGQPAEAAAAISDGLALAEATQERFWTPELLRQRGELALAAGDEALAIASLTEAVAVARGLGATTLALRAAAGLAGIPAGRAAGRAALAELLPAVPDPAGLPEARAAHALLAG